VAGDQRAPFVEFESAALCSGLAPDPFETGLGVPFELLPSPSNLILDPWRLRFRRCSFSGCWTFTEGPGPSWISPCSGCAEVRRRLRPRAGGEDAWAASSDTWRGVWLATIGKSVSNGRAACRLVWFGAEMVVLEGNEGVVEVDGSSGVDGDGEWELSSARTTTAGVPLVDRSVERFSGKAGYLDVSAAGVVVTAGGGLLLRLREAEPALPSTTDA
jgi:hypothetical protein